MTEKQKNTVVNPVAASIDLSIPYDAAAKLADEASDKSIEYAAFKAKYESDVVEDVIAKSSKTVEKVSETIKSDEKTTENESTGIDLSIPYDAAAKLAYESSDKSMEYVAFKVKYESNGVAEVIAKSSLSARKVAETASPTSGTEAETKAEEEAKSPVLQ